MNRKSTVLSVLLATTICFTNIIGSFSAYADDLDNERQAISKSKAQYDLLDEQILSLNSEIANINIEIDQINTKLKDNETQIANTETEIESTKALLEQTEIEIAEIENREYLLKNAIKEVKEEYDYIFIDCPPSLGMLTINCLTAVDSVLIPIQCEYYALEGVSQLMQTIKLVKSRLNPNISIQGVVLSMFDGRANLSIQVVEEVKKYFKGSVYTTLIPRNVRLAEAPSHGMPVIYYDTKCRGTVAYLELAEEFIDLEEDII